MSQPSLLDLLLVCAAQPALLADAIVHTAKVRTNGPLSEKYKGHFLRSLMFDCCVKMLMANQQFGFFFHANCLYKKKMLPGLKGAMRVELLNI